VGPDRPAPDVIAERLAHMRDQAGRPILPMAPGTALCLVCPWVPWPWADLPTDMQARQHSEDTGRPTLYPHRKPATREPTAMDRLCGAFEAHSKPVAAALP
jgi:hypothetical protein